MKKILVPIDFSTASIAALDLACGIAKKSGSTVIALHVVEGASPESFALFQDDEPDFAEKKMYTYKLLERSSDLLTQLVMSPRYSAIKLSKELRVGNPFHGIHTLIANRNVDLVVMGVKGRAQWQEMIIGSNTEKVMRCSKIPVLTVKDKLKPVKFKRIVYATSLSVSEKFFSPMVRKIQQLYNSKIHFVYINTPDKFRRDGGIMKQLDKFASKLKLENYTINTYNDFSEEAGIINFAESINADMIALSSRGRTGFVRLLAGSIAEDVMNCAKRPTLTYVVKQ